MRKMSRVLDSDANAQSKYVLAMLGMLETHVHHLANVRYRMIWEPLQAVLMLGMLETHVHHLANVRYRMIWEPLQAVLIL